jgi:L-fuconolactonase
MCLDMGDQSRREVFGVWRHALFDLARRQNVVCKVGGLGLPFWGFRLDERTDAIGYEELSTLWRPYVEVAIEAFGVNRCMMESNYPPDSRSCGYVPLWNALKHIVRGASKEEKSALFRDTAARVYRIDMS